jgi:hypothetical protein
MLSGCALTEVSVSPFRGGDPAATPSSSPSSSVPGSSVNGRMSASSPPATGRPEAIRSCGGGPHARCRPVVAARRTSWTSGVASVTQSASRWGSCSPSGHICLNWRLVLMPDTVRNYVLIHELMHLRRLDHCATSGALAACVPRLPKRAALAPRTQYLLGNELTHHWRIGGMADW